MIKFYLKLLIVGFCFMSCSSTTIEEEMVDETPAAKITYNQNVKTIIDNSCATSGCHSGTNPTGGLLLTTYTNVKGGVEDYGLINRMNNNSNPMPVTGLLDQATRTIMDQWVADGLLEN